MTAIADQMNALRPMAAAEAKLYSAATKHFSASGATFATLDRIVSEVRGDPACLRALVGHYLKHVVIPDMKGATETQGGGRSGLSSKGHASFSPDPAPNADGGANHAEPVKGLNSRSLPSAPREFTLPHRAGKVHVGPRQVHPGHLVLRSHSRPDVIQKQPSATDLAAAKAARKAIALTVLDSFKVRDGRSIGDVPVADLEKLRNLNAQEASVIRQIQRHVANAPHDALVRDIIKASDLERMIQRAAEVADAS